MFVCPLFTVQRLKVDVFDDDTTHYSKLSVKHVLRMWFTFWQNDSNALQLDNIILLVKYKIPLYFQKSNKHFGTVLIYLRGLKTYNSRIVHDICS